MATFEGLKGGEGLDKGGAGAGFDSELPGVAAASVFVEGRERWREDEGGVWLEGLVESLDVFDGGGFGFEGETETGEVGIGREGGATALLEEIVGEGWVVGGEGGLNDGVVGLVGLDNDAGGVKVAATDAADDLGEEFEGAFFGGEIGEGEAGVGLDDADGGELREVEAAGEGLGADEDLVGTGFDVGIERGEGFGFEVVAVKTGDFSLGKEAGELGFEEFGAEAFVDEVWLVTLGTGTGDRGGVAAEMADEGIGVGVEGEGEVAVGAEGLPAAVITEGERGGTAAVVEDEGLVVLVEVVLEGGEQRLGEIAVAREEGAVLEVDDGDGGGLGGGFGLMVEGDKGGFLASEVIIDEVGSGGAENAGDFEGSGNVAGEAKGGIAGGVFLVVGGFVGFVDEDEAEVVEGGEEGGTGADDDGGGGGC